MDEKNYGFSQESTDRAQREMASFWDVQNRVFNVYRDYLVHWVERRQEGAKAAVDVTQELMACNGGPKNVMDIYGKFVSCALERWVDDLGEYTKCQGHATSLWQSRMEGSADAAREQTKEMASQAERDLKSVSAKTKP